MHEIKVGSIVVRSFALLVVLSATQQALAQDVATLYPKMAPIEQYLMPDRAAEIALARSAAPESISSDATILVLGRQGYETAVEGKNRPSPLRSCRERRSCRYAKLLCRVPVR